MFIAKGILYGRKRLYAVWNKDFKLKNTRNWSANLFMEKQIC